jgi:hypothetical protein
MAVVLLPVAPARKAAALSPLRTGHRRPESDPGMAQVGIRRPGGIGSHK